MSDLIESRSSIQINGEMIFKTEKRRDIMEETNKLFDTLERIMKKNTHADRDNIRHTLLLLQEKPVDRLRRALIRARKFNIYQRRD